MGDAEVLHSSGATSTQILATDIRQALDNPAVKAIVLNIDSPGGVASGINELADMIYAGRSQKRIVAYVGGTGASAAYWIASAAHEVVVDDTAMVGSIGVVVEVLVDAATGKGAKRYEIVSRNAPNKRPDLATEQGRAKVGETVDAMAAVFENKVARNLGVAPGRVPAMGGHGGLLVGSAAVKSGLAHRLGSLEGLIASLSKGGAVAAPVRQNVASLNGAAEKARIAGIMALAAPGTGYDAHINAAIAEGLSVDATGLRLLQITQAHSASVSAAAAATLKPPAMRPEQFSTRAIWKNRRPKR